MTSRIRKVRPLGQEKFAAISAVEGLELSAAAKKRRAAALARKLTPDEARREIIRAHAGRDAR